MIRWLVIGILFAGVIGGFAWWRSSVLEDLPPPVSPAQAPAAVVIPPVAEVSREEFLRLEEERLRQKAAEAGVEFTTSTPEETAPSSAPAVSVPESVSSTDEAIAASSTAAEETLASTAAASSTPMSAEGMSSSTATSTPAVATSTPPASAGASSTATSTAASTATSTQTSSAASSTATSTTPAANPRQFQIDGAGFCEYNLGVSSVILSGYPLASDVSVSGSWITSWTPTRVVFVAPDSVPAGTYKAMVRGVGSSGYCATTTSSPLMVKVF